MILSADFYQRPDVVTLSRELLGKVLVTNFDGLYTSGMIVETEAYAGTSDKASHAFWNRKTHRTSIMYKPGGVAYVYLCYGLHHLFNIVTNLEDIPHAILIRGIEPMDGIDTILQRRKKDKLTPAITAGPGIASEALGIKKQHTGATLQGPEIYIEDRGIIIPEEDIIAGTRVGIAYAEEDAYLPYRFSIRGNKFVSKGKGL